MARNTRIHGGLKYSRLHDIMLALMCWNWDFSMDTCEGILTIHGIDRATFLIEAVKEAGQGIPEDLVFNLGEGLEDVTLDVRF